MSKKKEKFVYIHTRPTNVCFNGVSFPLLGGDVIKCYPEFIAAFIPEDKYRLVPPGSEVDKRAVKYNFGSSPIFLRPDPTGGLPMRSVPGPRKTKTPAPYSPATVEEAPDNPYALLSELETPTIEIGTGLDTPTSPDPKPESLTTAPPSERPEPTEEEDELKGLESGFEVEDEESTSGAEDIPADNLEDEELEDDTQDDTQLPIPGRTAIRRLKRDEMYAVAIEHGIEVAEDAARGVILKALWKAFKYDEE